MVEKIKDTSIRIRSEMNEWMDCIFIVSEEDAVRAEKVLQEAWDSYWEDGDGWCYGNYLEDKLINAGIAFDSYYADHYEFYHQRYQVYPCGRDTFRI